MEKLERYLQFMREAERLLDSRNVPFVSLPEIMDKAHREDPLQVKTPQS